MTYVRSFIVNMLIFRNNKIEQNLVKGTKTCFEYLLLIVIEIYEKKLKNNFLIGSNNKD